MRKRRGTLKRLASSATLLCGAALLLAAYAGDVSAQTGLTPIEELGSFLYFDTNLSEPAGQACASCHEPAFGFVDPDSHLPVSEGVIPGLFGGRNSPMSAYAMYAPILDFDEGEGLWIGGQFWDGRATGDVLDDPLADQALGPFVNPVEMNNPDKASVIADVAASSYAGLFEQVWAQLFVEKPVRRPLIYQDLGQPGAVFDRLDFAHLAASLNDSREHG